MEAIAKRLVSAHRMSLLQREYFKATHDPLTGLINHITLDERIEHEIAVAERHHRAFALLVLEISDFDEIAQRYSKTAANNILIEFAKRLKACVRTTDSVARVEGEIFAILLPDIKLVRHVVKIIQSININLMNAFNINDIDHVLSASIGIAFFPNDGDHKEQLMENAHAAMCQARSRSEKNYLFYAVDIEEDVDQQLQLEASLRNAVEQHQYDIRYNPVRMVSDDTLTYRQAEVVWHDANLQRQSRADISSLIDSLELGKLFADLVLDSVCQQLSAESNNPDLQDIPMLVHINRAQLQDLKVANRFDAILRSYAVEPQRLCLIVNEAFLDTHPDTAVAQLKTLRRAGFQIILNDFNCTFSRLDLLSELGIKMVRLGSSFTQDLTGDMDKLDFMAAMLGFVHRMRIQTLVPDINDPHQRARLSRLNKHGLSGIHWQGDYSNDC